MNMKQFIEVTNSESAIKKFLKKMSKELEKEYGPAPRLECYPTLPAEWNSILSLLLRLSMPWINRGWKWMIIRRLELDEELRKRAHNFGMTPYMTKRAIGPFTEELISSRENLRKILMSMAYKSDLRSIPMDFGDIKAVEVNNVQAY